MAGNYDVILDDEEVTSFKSVLSNFLARFEHHENELLACQQQHEQHLHQLQLAQSNGPPLPLSRPPLMVGSYVNEFKMLKELSRVLKENTANYIDGLECYNQPKNRYKDIIPFNHSRVVLDQISELEPGSDYINANYVQGPTGSQRSYIACQGPLPHTLTDFWRMIWECRVSVIVMACNEQEMGRAKCEQYWPDQVDTSSTYGNTRVTLLRERQINSDFLIRKFSVQLLAPEPEICSRPHSNQTPVSVSSPPPPPLSTQSDGSKLESKLTLKVNDQLANAHCIGDSNNNHIHVPTQNGNHRSSQEHSSGFSNSGNSSTSNESINTPDHLPGANLTSGRHKTRRAENYLNQSPPSSHFHNQNPAQTKLDEQKKAQENNRAVLMERTVCQFHFQGWQDHGVPDSVQSILELIRLIREVQPGYSSSIVVHCSAGCGRTGTICCIDYVYGLMRMGKLAPDFDLFTIISHMRQQRMAMVQTIDQYILCHRAVAALFVQQLQLLEFGTNQSRLLSNGPGEQVVGYDELAAQGQAESDGIKETDGSNQYDTSTSTVATDEQSSNSKISADQFDVDRDDGGAEDDEDIGPVFI